MNLEMPGCFTLGQDLVHESLQLLAHHRLLVVFEKGVGMELNKNPFRSTLHSDLRALPTPEPIHLQRIVIRKRAIVDSGYRQAVNSPAPVKNEGPVNDYWQNRLI